MSMVCQTVLTQLQSHAVVNVQVRRLLSSAEPTTVRIANAPEVGDPEMQALQQARLLALGMRTMTLPLGRGALTLGHTPPPILSPISHDKLHDQSLLNVTELFYLACLEVGFLLRAIQCLTTGEELCKVVQNAVIHDHSAELPQQPESTLKPERQSEH